MTQDKSLKLTPHESPSFDALSAKDQRKFTRAITKGRKFFVQQDWPEAAKLYLEAWHIDLNNQDLLVIIAHVMVQLGVRAKAIEVLEKALEVAGPTQAILAIMGQMAFEMEMHDIAEKLGRISVEAYPDDPNAYLALANGLGGQERYDESIDMLQATIPLFPEFADLWNVLGSHVSNRDGEQQAIVFYEEALRLDPTDYKYHNNMALICHHLGDHEASIKYSRESLRLKPNVGDVRLGLGVSLIATGEVAEGWEHYEGRRDPKRKGAIIFLHETSKEYNIPEWNGDPLAGKSIFLAAEQGIGDEFLFGHACAQLYGTAGQLLIGVERRLVTLFQRSFPKAIVCTHGTIRREGYLYRSFPDFESKFSDGSLSPDYTTLMGTAAGKVWHGLSAFDGFRSGYLTPDPDKKAEWRHRLAELGGKPKIGICWRSGRLTADRLRNYASIAELEPIFAVDDVELINVQYGDCAVELAEAREKYGREIIDFEDLDLKEDLDDTIALMSELDLVIGPASAPTMMAAATGIPTWWFSFSRPWWAFGEDVVPFLESGRVYKHKIGTSWLDVTSRISEDLVKFITSEKERGGGIFDLTAGK